MKKLTIKVRGREVAAYGPFIAPNGAEYYLIQCGYFCDLPDEFVVEGVYGGLNEGQEYYVMSKDSVHYSFAMAVINLAVANALGGSKCATDEPARTLMFPMDEETEQ